MSRTQRTVTSAPHAFRAEEHGSARFTATQAKNEFGRALEMALRGETVVITKHDTPKAILISVDQFKNLTRASKSTLLSLSAEFDGLLARMQKPKARAGMKRHLGRHQRNWEERPY